MTRFRLFACAAGLLLILATPQAHLGVAERSLRGEACAGSIHELSYSQKKRAKKMRELAHARSQWAMQVEEARIRAIHLRLETGSGTCWPFVSRARGQACEASSKLSIARMFGMSRSKVHALPLRPFTTS